MRRHRTAPGFLLALAALLAGTVAATGSAGAAPGGPAGETPAGTAPAAARAVPLAEQRASAAFWTADRMRGAAPLDLSLTPAAAQSLRAPAAEGGATTVVPGTAPAAFPQAGAPWTGGGAVVSTSGRVFFTFQGRTASCSGNAVTSQNAGTVITAGHCVKYQGSWHTNWVFVPGYDNGQAPYGQWAASRTLTTPQWEASEDINHDIGAAVVAPLDGRTLTSVVGAQGLQFNGGYNKRMYAFGFPAASPYDGTKLIHCSGNSSKDFLLTQDHGLGCNMTGGSSGGPWFTGFDEATGRGLQVSVNSFGYTFLPNRMFGPYFGDVAKALYDRAQTS
ncbi:trypsin-like serine peptidase [Streptomyces pilosus]|uniref:Peptidase n=1 Tax=Streptomyces pilosus TaxID=28893 RepID=A0A918F0J0_9ACTN|nr:peptidase [Streptomyces pilosus]GGQ93776.1 peptidase [Streptomyces pilosus]GGV46906.1 peptidase [Streptomyces pilosus]